MMKGRRVAAIGLVLLCGFSSVVLARAAKNKKVQDAAAAPATVEDFAWMAGRWTGMAGAASIENVCSAPARGQMMCMFRSSNDQKVLSLEFISLIQTPGGIEEHIRFLLPDLTDDDPKSVTLKVESHTAGKTVFVNPDGNMPKRTTLTRNGPDEMLSHIEMITPQGKSIFIDAKWDRAK
jgi:hypothetical protein